MKALINTILYQPLYNLFILLVALLPGPNVALAIIALTALVRLALLPLKNKAIKLQLKQQELQPEIKRLQETHKDDKSALAAAQMQLYKDKGMNPIGGCLPSLFQLPLLIILYYVFRDGLNPEQYRLLYSFVDPPTAVQTSFLWVKDLTKQDPTYILPILAGAAQYLFSRSLMGMIPSSSNKNDKEDMAVMMQKQMMYLAPVMTILIARTLPAGLSLYWVVASLLDWYFQVVGMKRFQTQAVETPKTTVTIRRKRKKT